MFESSILEIVYIEGGIPEVMGRFFYFFLKKKVSGKYICPYGCIIYYISNIKLKPMYGLNFTIQPIQDKCS